MLGKKDGSKRFCVDFRKLNAETLLDPFPIPRIDDVLDSMSGAIWFSSLDLKSGYWQMELDESSIPKTAFSTPDGHYEFKRLPFGLKNAPADFSRLMYQLLGHLPFVKIYIDDITIFSKNLKDHIEHLEEVLSILNTSGLKLNREKCSLFRKEIKILGFVISKNGIMMDKSKVECIQKRKRPENVKQIQEFFGLTNHFRRFVKDYAKISYPINQLLKKDTPFVWSLECEEAFQNLKKRLIEYPILRLPDFSKKFFLYLDASDKAIGAILCQRDEDENEYVIMYASRTL
jgi:hypothetical protein